MAGTLVAERLAATRRWLQEVSYRHYVIQLMLTRRDNWRALEALLREWADAGRLERVHIYETRVRGEPWYGVLYGEYATLGEARTALSALPPELRSHQPFVRNVRDIGAVQREAVGG